MFTRNLKTVYSSPKERKGQEVIYEKQTNTEIEVSPTDSRKDKVKFRIPSSLLNVPQFGEDAGNGRAVPGSAAKEVIERFGEEWLDNFINDNLASDARASFLAALGNVTSRDGKSDDEIIANALTKAENYSYDRVTVKERSERLESAAEDLKAGKISKEQAAEILLAMFK